MVRVGVVPALLTSLLLGGCGPSHGGGPATPPPTQEGSAAAPPRTQPPSAAASEAAALDKPVPKACDLLSKAEIGKLTGQSVDSRVDASLPSPPTQSGCVWNLRPGGALYLNLLRQTPAGFQRHASGSTPVPGIGDAAYDEDIHVHFWVLFGTVELDIVVRSAESDAKRLERAVEVARTVGARL